MTNSSDLAPSRHRNRQIFVRVSDAEKARIIEKARKLGMGISEYLRHLLAK